MRNSTLEQVSLIVASDADVVAARQAGRKLAEKIGFAGSDLALIATAISEVARNMIAYAGRGEIVVGFVNDRGRLGVQVIAKDRGPGIPDVDLAMRDGYTTSGGMGLGLPGARRLMDEFAISSEVAKGTLIVMTKWVRGRG